MGFADKRRVLSDYTKKSPQDTIHEGSVEVNYKISLSRKGESSYLPPLRIELNNESGMKEELVLSLADINNGKTEGPEFIIGEIYASLAFLYRRAYTKLRGASKIADMAKDLTQVAAAVADEAFVFATSFLEEYTAAE